jgi:hypothetical protein
VTRDKGAFGPVVIEPLLRQGLSRGNGLIGLLLRRRLLVYIAAFAFTMSVFTEIAFALGGPGPPAVYIEVTPKESPVADSCPALYEIKLISQELFQGALNLTAVDQPKGVTATFGPNPILIPMFNDGTVYLMVEVSPDTPLGRHTVHIEVTPLPGPGSSYNEDFFINGDPSFVLNVGSCGSPLGEARTTTTTTNLMGSNRTVTTVKMSTETRVSTTTFSTTLTSTSTTTSTERVTEPATYAWAAGATVAAAVMAVVMVLRKSK